jgi:hypothetical protein
LEEDAEVVVSSAEVVSSAMSGAVVDEPAFPDLSVGSPPPQAAKERARIVRRDRYPATAAALIVSLLLCRVPVVSVVVWLTSL